MGKDPLELRSDPGQRTAARAPLQIVVIGAGYAGMLATVRLAGKIKAEIGRRRAAITLVNLSDVFVERLRLHQFAANEPIAKRPIEHTLRGTGVSFLRGTVTSIDPVRHTLEIETDSGRRQMQYDKLLYALGSTINRDSVPGVREHAYVLTPTGENSASALRGVLLDLSASHRQARLLVVGAGPTGIEAAAEFASTYPNLSVQLVTKSVFGKFANADVAGYMRRSLEKLGVTIQDHTAIREVRAGQALTQAGAVLPFDLCLWAGGFAVPQLAKQAGLAVNERGQVLVDPRLRSISHPDVYAVGDSASPVEIPGYPVRMAALVATIMGAHGADNLSAAIRGQEQRPFSFAYLGQGIALGKQNAIGFNNYPDDVAKLPYFTGRLGYEGREFFVRLLADMPNLERRIPGFTFWLGKGRYDQLKRRAKTAGSVPARRSASSYQRRGL